MAVGITTGIKHTDPFELVLSNNSYIITGSNQQGTFAISASSPSDGQIYAISSNPDIIKIQQVTQQVTQTSNLSTIFFITKNYGSAIITVGQDVGTGYYADKTPEIKSVYVCMRHDVGDTLNDTNWSVISEVAQDGCGSLYWAIGDAKNITLNGNIGAGCTLNNYACGVFILHFNLPINNVADNNIIFGGFTQINPGYISGDIIYDITIVDSKDSRDNSDGTLYFNISHWNTGTGDFIYGSNLGGWQGCDLRYDILGATSTQPSGYGSANLDTARTGYNATSATLTNPKANTLLAALPADFRSVLKLWNRWISAKRHISLSVEDEIPNDIEEIIDAVTLLTEFEVWGSCTKSNPYEQNYQVQMDYYKMGKQQARCDQTFVYIKYWWLASPTIWDNFYWCVMDANKNTNTSHKPDTSAAYNSHGIAPAFKV